MVRYFDEELTTLIVIASIQAQEKHDASVFDIVCTNVRNDIKSLDVCIKDLRKSIVEGKKLYGYYVLSYKYMSNSKDKIRGQMSELQMLTTMLY